MTKQNGNDVKDYHAYVNDHRWYETYSNYQKKYLENPKESDKKSAQLVLSSLKDLKEMLPRERPLRILDIGCSTGNFLAYLRSLLHEAQLIGGDLMVPVIEECLGNPMLQSIQFEVMDVFDIPSNPPFDIIVANAVNVYFEPDEYLAALQSISNALVPGGYFIAYEWVFPEDKEQRIVEKSEGHPEGLKFWFRSQPSVTRALRLAGFDQIEIDPFDIPIDLPKPEVLTGTDADLVTFTVRDADTGRRLMFRGSLFQPWAHIHARKQSEM